MRKRDHYELEYKKRIVDEFLGGELSAKKIADREGLIPAQIYKWRTQLENRKRSDRLDQIQIEEPGITLEQARRIRELEEELEATQQKLAQTVLENDLLKKIHPSFQSEKRSSGYIETKRTLARSKGRVK